jgi:hypothetical protein
MNMAKLKHAIVNIAFNRPQYLERVLAGIEKQGWEPQKYDFVSFVDGPRAGNKGDKAGIMENCDLLQAFIGRMGEVFGAATIINRVENVGVNVNVLDALYKVFVTNKYDEAIIIEEDVLPLKGFKEWMEWGLQNLVGKKTERCCNQGTILNVVCFSEPERKDSNPAAYQLARWFTPWGWATKGDIWRHNFEHKVVKMYVDGCMTDVSYTQVHQQAFDLHPAKHKSKFITWRGEEIVRCEWGWDNFTNMVGEVQDLYEAHPVVPRTINIGKVGIHQDGNGIYPELIERKCTSEDFDLVKDNFVEVD